MLKTIIQKLNLSQISGLIVVSIVLFCGLLISILTYSDLKSLLQQELQFDVERQLKRLAVASADDMARQDRVSLSVLLNDWTTGPAITQIRVLDHDGEVIARNGKAEANAELMSQSITRDDLALGVLEASVSLESARNAAARYFSLALLATALLSLVGGLLAYRLASYPSRYFRQLQQYVDQEASGITPDIPEVPNLPECLALQQSLEKLAEQRQQQQTLQQALNQFLYQPETDLESGTTYRNCAMLYLEIPNLLELQQQMTAAELASALNHYHRLISHAAKVYNGRLDRYQGDGIVVIFGLHEHSERDSLNCIYAASLFLGLLRYLRIKGKEPQGFEFRCAAHKGPVLIAPIDESEEDSETPHLHYNLIGDSLYWASHLARHGDDNHLLASEALVSGLPEHSIGWRQGPDFQNLQGNPQGTFWLQSLPETTISLINRQIHRIASITDDVH
ncbi:MAG: hypothetical protein CMI09_07910 [Oceanospirillaceae bacterium]|nr:hypothetical protein [Oceanospirillaceae bacterium]